MREEEVEVSKTDGVGVKRAGTLVVRGAAPCLM